MENLTKYQLIEKVRQLVETHFSQRAADYDKKKSFPFEDFKDLFEAGLLGTLISKDYGGSGLGHHRGDILTHWMLTKEIAKANMALARCWEGHANAQLLLDNIATPSQKEKWFKGIIEDGMIWSVWSGEPQSVKPGEQQKFGTQVKVTPDGYIVSGTKIFCSSAPGANWAIILVNPKGPGGARHARAPEDLIMLACDLKDASISFDDSWWDPIGMNASVSYLVRFDKTFIPKENLLGYPGQYLIEDWQTKLTPQFAATFLGGAEAAYDQTMSYIKKRKVEKDPYIQHRLAKMSINIETSNLWLQKTANLWERGAHLEAKIAGNSSRYLIEQLAMETVNHALHICGARALIRPSVLERIYRDLSFYARHDNDDLVLASVGQALLGEVTGISFFKTADNKVEG